MIAETRQALLRRVATLNDSFARHELSWEEWDSKITPVLRALTPELQRGLPETARRKASAAPELAAV